MDEGAPPRRIRWGMVGGGRGAFIGEVHRRAARLDDGYELLAGALSSDPERARLSAQDCRIAPERAHADYAAMARAEAARPDGIEAVSIVTPNHRHHAVAKAFLEQGIHVICDKPLATSLADARDLVALARARNLLLGVTYNYSGYPMVRHARDLVRGGAIGRVRMVQAEFVLGWLSTALEAEGAKQAEWRTDPAQAGPSGVVGDVGTHAFHLAQFVTGLELEAVSADIATFVPGRRLEDNATMMLRWRGGARGAIWASMVAAGETVGLRLRVYGETGHIAWDQSYPDDLQVRPLNGEAHVLARGGKLSPAAKAATRLVAGLPEGFFEAFANLYRDYASIITALREGTPPPEPIAPTGEDGVAGLAFVEAVLNSARRDGAWVRPT
ncbi:Gfo/Idh/MocA family protein [Labrys wisconsinensis]|uniref:Dehydrogenase n=1 Tax=Labrys wisconsinensis TaxID=425677 RepID=A0ABU0JP57_9HYPH|nr:Gfo/Idh/MocA family oxidoreductase [Labrys wisconsinensis]MDQ0475276.1 putative dehydrogenase [Labrys wisconsinensis]